MHQTEAAATRSAADSDVRGRQTDRRGALRLAAGAACALLLPRAAFATDHRIDFSGGPVRRAAVDYTLRGRNDGRFLFDATAGERLSVRLRIDHADARFNIWAPETRRALFISNRSPDPYAFDGVLPKAGEYAIQVFLAGASARGDVDLPLRLDVTLSPATTG